MSSFYTPEMREYVRSRDWPKGLLFEVVEYKDSLGIRFYSHNFDNMDGVDKHQAAMMIKEVIEKFRSLGIPTYLEKAE